MKSPLGIKKNIHDMNEIFLCNFIFARYIVALDMIPIANDIALFGDSHTHLYMTPQ